MAFKDRPLGYALTLHSLIDASSKFVKKSVCQWLEVTFKSWFHTKIVSVKFSQREKGLRFSIILRLGAVHKRLPQSGGEEVGKCEHLSDKGKGGVLQMRTLHFLVQKNFGFFEIYGVFAQTMMGGGEQVRTREKGSRFFSILCGRHGREDGYLKFQHKLLKIYFNFKLLKIYFNSYSTSLSCAVFFLLKLVRTAIEW